jgi:hypothetical protein
MGGVSREVNTAQLVGGLGAGAAPDHVRDTHRDTPIPAGLE